jgi:UDP-glucose 4-epimerase
MRMTPLSPYALSKLAAEEYFRVFHRVYGLETVSLRYFNVFGARQRPDSQYAAVIPKFITAMMQGRSPTVHGDGLQSRDFTYVLNNVEANILAATAPANKVAGRVFNIACDDQHNLLKLIDVINATLGTQIKPQFVASRAGDVRDSRADVSLAREAFSYEPRVGFLEGMALTIQSYEDHSLK